MDVFGSIGLTKLSKVDEYRLHRRRVADVVGDVLERLAKRARGLQPALRIARQRREHDLVEVLAANEAPDRFERLIMVGPSPRYINDEGYIGGFERKDIEGLFEMMDRNFIGWANFMAPAIMKNSDRPRSEERRVGKECGL